jgi:hypothetical protein
MPESPMHSPAPVSSIVSTLPRSYRRAPLKEHFVQVAVEILTGYEELSDGALLTYIALLSFDFFDSERGDHKGVAYPSIETLCAKRGKSRSTIYSHLAELEQCGLIAPIPGVGWRLYNPPERPVDPQPTIHWSESKGAATDNDSAREDNAQMSLPSADTPSMQEPFACTPKFRKSGQGIKEEEEEITIPKQKQYSEAGETQAHGEEQRVVMHLQECGFAPWLAHKFIQQYGTQRVRRQLLHLDAQRRRGVLIQNCARWLYRAIERDYKFPQEQMHQPQNANHPHYEIGARITLPNGEVVYELVEQDRGVSNKPQGAPTPPLAS